MAEKIMEILKQFNCKAVIFDLDGTILDNNAFHLKTWKQYLKDIGREMTDEEFNKHLNGRTNKDVVRYLYGEQSSDEEITRHTLAKESLYRKLYKPFIKPVEGLTELLAVLNQEGVPMAIATSGIKPNIEFMFENVPIKKYFKIVVDSSFISRGKPDPEIFLKAAEFLNMPPAECLVFEDAVVGINSAKAAGMRVIAIATTEPKQELKDADMIIDLYNELL